jgi:hypothetical protein
MDLGIKLTPNFTLREFLKGQETEFQKLDNITRDMIVENLYRLAHLLENVRLFPIHITSGWRSVEKNKQVGGSERSLHLLGMACDFFTQGLKFAEIFDKSKKIGEFIVYFKKGKKDYIRFHLGLVSLTRNKQNHYAWAWEGEKNYFPINNYDHFVNLINKMTNFKIESIKGGK